jgi:hypothetical protein
VVSEGSVSATLYGGPPPPGSPRLGSPFDQTVVLYGVAPSVADPHPGIGQEPYAPPWVTTTTITGGGIISGGGAYVPPTPAHLESLAEITKLRVDLSRAVARAEAAEALLAEAKELRQRILDDPAADARRALVFEVVSAADIDHMLECVVCGETEGCDMEATVRCDRRGQRRRITIGAHSTCVTGSAT